jgi:hypothetical protein
MPAVCATSAITTEVTTYKAIKMYGAVPRVLWLSFGSVDWVILLCSKPRSLALQWWGCISTKLKLAKELGTVYTVNVRNHDPVKEIKLGGANVAVSLEQAYQGEWVPPVDGEYFEVPSPVDGKIFTQVARSKKEDIDLALDKAHQAKEKWGNTSVMERSNILLKIADRMEQNLERLALSETWDNGKAIRETLNADLPLAI